MLPLLEFWSDNTKAIGVQAISSGCLDAFQQIGFVLDESRFWMIRPTETLDVNWSSEWLLDPLESAKAPAIAAVLKDAFTGGVGQYGKRDL